MRSEDIGCLGEIVADGALHRFHVDGDPKGKRNGWYVLYIDERPAGMFGCNKRLGDRKMTWRATAGLKSLTADERHKLAEASAAARAKRDADELERHLAAQKLADACWTAAKGSTTHPYLVKKQIEPHGAKVGVWKKQRPDGSYYTVAADALLIPMRDEEKGVWGLQAIFAEPVFMGGEDRGKDFIFGARKRGLWFSIGKPTVIDGALTILLCEGFATGASLHQATGAGVLVCFDRGNLLHVARKARAMLPVDARLVICGDEDLFTFVRGEPTNPGRIAALDAAKAVGGIAVFPQFSNLKSNPTDFNDLHLREGLEAVKGLIFSSWTPGEDDKLRTQTTQVGKLDFSSEPSEAGRASALPSSAKQTATVYPDESIWPAGYDSRSDGLYLGTEPGSVRLCDPIRVIGSGRAINGKGWGKVVAFQDHDRVEKVHFLSNAAMSKSPSAALAALADAGFTFLPSRTQQEKLVTAIFSARTRRRYLIAGSCGWIGNSFVYPGGAVQGAEDEPVMFVGGDAKPYLQTGTIEDWRRNVGQLARGNDILVLSIGVALCGPLLGPLRLEGSGFNLRGSSSTGKTSALSAAASVWSGGLGCGIQSWRSTPNGFEGIAAAHSESFLALDELGLVPPDIAGSTAYALSSGQGKNRAVETGRLAAQATWRLAYLSTGEISLSDHIRSAPNKPRSMVGQSVRLVDVDVGRGRQFGAWQELHGFSDGAEFSKALKANAQQHGGWLGPAFVAALQADAGFVERAQHMMAEFQRSASLEGDNGQVSRVVERFGLVAVACELAVGYGLLPWEQGAPTKSIQNVLAVWLETAGSRTVAHEDVEVVSRVKAAIEQRGSQFASLSGVELGSGRSFELLGYVSDDRSKFLFNRAGFEQVTGRTARQAADILDRHGLLERGDGDHFARKVVVAGHQHRLYTVYAKILDLDV